MKLLTDPSTPHNVGHMNVHSPPAERLSRDDRTAQMREARRTSILTAACEMAVAKGWNNLTRDSVAKAAGVADGSVNHEFGTMDALRDAVMQEAIRTEKLHIIAQGILAGNELARNAPPALIKRAVHALA